MDKVARTAIVAGDSILFKRGDTLTVGELSTQVQSPMYPGTEANPIVFDAYGTGNNPILFGDFTGATWTQRAGYDSVWVTYAGQYVAGAFGWEDSADTWRLMTRVGGEIKFYLNDADSLDAYLNSFTASSFGPGSAANNNCDSIYVKTWDGNAPQVRIFRQNQFSGDYVTVQNLDFRNWWSALYGIGMTYSNFRNVSTRNCMNIALRFSTSQYCRIDSSRSDSTAYTPHYLGAGGYGNYMSYDSTFATRDTVLDIYRRVELSAVGMQQDTASVIEYGYYEDSQIGGLDTFYNVDDTVRNCTFNDVDGGIILLGTRWVAHNNTITVTSNDYTAGITIYLTGTGESKAYDNTITAPRPGLSVSNAFAGGTAVFNNNTVTLSEGNARFSNFQYTSGVTSTNNNFFGVGTWYAGLFPDEVQYSTLALFQAEGYEAGSTINEAGGTGDTLSISANGTATQTILSSITLEALTDSAGVRKYGHPVVWAISSAPAGSWEHSISATADTTDELGVTSTILTLGYKAGDYVITCTSDEALEGSPLTFTITATRTREALLK